MRKKNVGTRITTFEAVIEETEVFIVRRRPVSTPKCERCGFERAEGTYGPGPGTEVGRGVEYQAAPPILGEEK